MKQFGLNVIEPPKRCPAKGKCHCLARSWGDPEPEAPESIWCFGLRKDDDFPGKQNAIQTVPSDCIVSCNLLGSHTEDAGVQTTIMNIPDIHLVLEVWMKALNKIGMLRQVFVAAIMSQNDEALKEMFNDGLIKVDDESVMTSVDCSCEQLYLAYNHDPLPKEIEGLKKYHESLGHEVKVSKKKRIGDVWSPPWFDY